METSIFPIFEFVYSFENERYSSRAESWFMNQRNLEMLIKILLKVG